MPCQQFPESDPPANHNGMFNTLAECEQECQCGSTPALPISVYRTGGTAVNNPPTPNNPAGCGFTLIGTISDINGSVTVSWVAGSTYSSVEAQAVDACGRCVFSGNAATGGAAASITVSYSSCSVGFPFVNTGNWCNNPMC